MKELENKIILFPIACANSVNSWKRSLGKTAWNKGLKFGKSNKNTRIEKGMFRVEKKFIIKNVCGGRICFELTVLTWKVLVLSKLKLFPKLI